MDLEVWVDDLNMTATMRDICFQPTAPDNQNCTIMSVLNYFQVDLLPSSESPLPIISLGPVYNIVV